MTRVCRVHIHESRARDKILGFMFYGSDRHVSISHYHFVVDDDVPPEVERAIKTWLESDVAMELRDYISKMFGEPCTP